MHREETLSEWLLGSLYIAHCDGDFSDDEKEVIFSIVRYWGGGSYSESRLLFAQVLDTFRQVIRASSRNGHDLLETLFPSGLLCNDLPIRQLVVGWIAVKHADSHVDPREREALYDLISLLPSVWSIPSLDHLRAEANELLNTIRSHRSGPLGIVFPEPAQASSIPEYQFYGGAVPFLGSNAHPNGELNEAILAIIDIEAPLVTSRLYRIFAQRSGMIKLQRLQKQILNRELSRLKSTGSIQIEDELDIGGLKYSTISRADGPAVLLRTAGPRILQEIPVSELLLGSCEITDRFGFVPGTKPHQAALRELFGGFSSRAVTVS